MSGSNTRGLTEADSQGELAEQEGDSEVNGLEG